MMENPLIEKYAGPVPRYTSYPTAPHFTDAVGPENYSKWLADLREGASLSVYCHIPFCDTLCWFCGCHTKMTRRYDPIASYLPALYSEIDLVACQIPEGAKVTHVHWGGGSPTILTPRDIKTLAERLHQQFDVMRDVEFAVEIDPRDLDEDRIEALARAGVNRASIGVQDFDPTVQTAINRRQTYEKTASVIAALRDRGIASINIDVMYGLPHQTTTTLAQTIAAVSQLKPDRIALFGYAHVPWMKRHQSMIDEDFLPGRQARFSQAQLAASLLTNAGYVRVGLDHFALPDDPIARAMTAGTLQRNFQGYTTDHADAVLGLGASAISSLPDGYVQNLVPTTDYKTKLAKQELATAKGVRLTREDRIRRYVIERLMCDLTYSATALEEQFGKPAHAAIAEAGELTRFCRDDMIEPTADGFSVTDIGRPFLRVICAAFDAHLNAGQARHSIAV